MNARHLPVATLLSVLAALGATACGRSVDVGWYEPPPADIGTAQRVVITDAYGREDAVDTVAIQARDAILAHGYFEATDRQHRTRLEVGRRGDVWLDTGDALEARTLYVRVDVLEWSAFTTETETLSEDGLEVYVDVLNTAHVLLSVTAADARGLVIDELEVEATAEEGGDLTDDQIAWLLEEASEDALREGLRDLLPAHRVDRVPLDDSDEALHETLDARMAPAAKVELLDRFLAAHPDHTGARYNRAAHKGAMGDFDGALADYDAALDRDRGNTMYAESRAKCADRAAAARALGR